MILCLDCGNTRIKWGLRASADAGWQASGAVATAMADRLAAGLPEIPERIFGCNVAGFAVQATVEATLGKAVHWNRAVPTQAGIRNGYANPAQLGADRWAALVGAWQLHHCAALVVCAGTATTIDVLDVNGIFRGGLILPGLDLMRDALTGNTAGLASAEGEYADLPDNTSDAISGGALHATLGAVERMARLLPAGSPCILSGGAGPRLLHHLSLPVHHHPLLILEGLACIAALPDNPA